MKIAFPIKVCLLAALALSKAVMADDHKAKKLTYSGPIIDSHIHATSHISDQQTSNRQKISEQMTRHNVVLSVVSIPNAADLNDWRSNESQSFLVGPSFPCYQGKYPRMNPCFEATGGWPDLHWLKSEIKAGRITVFGELLFAYYGISPADERMRPYYQLAAQYDIPIAVHAAHGPRKQARTEGCCPKFDEAMGDPLLLKPVLKEFPNLRVWLLHGGETHFHNQAIELMKQFPQVVTEMSIVNSILPRDLHYRLLKSYIDAGLEDRIIFGSDNVAIERTLERLNDFDFLTEGQREKILYDNAARFFRLSQSEIDKHHGLKSKEQAGSAKR